VNFSIDDEPGLYGRLIAIVICETRRTALASASTHHWKAKLWETLKQIDQLLGVSCINPSVDLTSMDDAIFCGGLSLFSKQLAQRLRQSQANSPKTYSFQLRKLQKIMAQLREQSSSTPPTAKKGTRMAKFLDRTKFFFSNLKISL